jgi:hypothetical protein
MNKLIIAALAVTTAFTACKKGVTTKRLQGDWTMTSGTSTSTNVWTSNSGSSGSNTQTTTTNYTYNGTKESGSRVVTNSNANYVSNNSNTTVDNGYTMTVSFDKEKQTYTMTTTGTELAKDNDITFEYFEATNIGGTVVYNPVTIDMQTTTTTTTTEKGFYSITGSSNGLEKNSQIVFTPSSSVSVIKATYKYFTANSTSEKSNLFTGTYNPSTGQISYSTAKSTEDYTNTATITAQSSGMVATVTERESSKMTLNFNDDSNYSSTQTNASTSSYKTTQKWIIEKK